MPPEPFYNKDPWLNSWQKTINEWHNKFRRVKNNLCGASSLRDFASGHLYYGTHSTEESIIIREWAPNANSVFLVGTINKWKEESHYEFVRLNKEGDWELELPQKDLPEGELYKLSVNWDGGSGLRIPSYAQCLVQDPDTKLFSARHSAQTNNYIWKNPNYVPHGKSPLIYEAHIGMSSEKEKVSDFEEFRLKVLPRIARNGYNTLQLMAIQEHPYYGSFGYHVSSYFAVSSRFGTPDEFRALIDDAHAFGISVIMDLVHSHSVRNVNEGLGLFAGDQGQYFHAGEKGLHPAWDSLCFDYGKEHVMHFLLSNCRYWIEEYNIDGFRFDGITSMLYYDHGLNRDFTEYGMYFDGNQDTDAIVYLKLANTLIHEIRQGAVSVAEEMSGMPGTSAAIEELGLGFDYRLNMGAPDFWIKTIKEKSDENWDVDELFFEMSRHRTEEKTITYCESHDQALVGDKTLMFRLADAEIYTSMDKESKSIIIDRAIALHKMIRLFTAGTGQSGYLNFMGNEFGHPEWIDFPRKDNGWSYKYARRQWSLADNSNLKYGYLYAFDRSLIRLCESEGIYNSDYIEKIYSNKQDCVVAFSREDLLFVFNFHPINSYSDYRIPATGRYRIILNSDSADYGGYERVDSSMIYLSSRIQHAQLSEAMSLPLYLPTRTALVLKSTPLRKINQSI
ncbi:MAG: alpha amylase C-terminal domain-containing protein [Bacteroidales bacterium]|nr:alpha amylase C-terminal domain-containing protein [Bacteroidales bacterium]